MSRKCTEGGRLGAQMVLPHEVQPGPCASQRQGVPGTTQHPPLDGNHPFTWALAQGMSPKWPLCQAVRASSALLRDICTGLLQGGCSQE